MNKRFFWVFVLFCSTLLSSLADVSPAYACTCKRKTGCSYSGEVLASVIDYPDGRTRTHFQLRKHDTGELLDLEFAGKVPKGLLATGVKVNIQGKRLRNRKTFAVAADSNGNSKVTITSAGSEAAGVTGTKSLAVVIISSADFSQGVSDADIDSIFFSGARNVSGLYQISSYGNMTFSKAGIYRTTLSYATASSCDNFKYSTDAMSQLGNISAQYIVYIVPTTACTWGGWAYLNLSGAWIRADYALYGDIIAHELGHNVGLHHASINPANDETNQGEYSDMSCIMGYGAVGWRHFNAAHKDQEGWFPNGRRLDISSSTTSTIAALEATPTTTALPYVLRLPRYSDYYYVSYRSPLDNYSDGLLSGYNANIPYHISIHRASSAPGYSYLISNLSPGQAWTDTINGAVINFTGSDQMSATVQVSYTCIARQMAISLQPVLQSTNVAGTQKNYLVVVTNNDSIGCGTGHFILSSSLPPGFTGAFDSTSFDISSGGSASTNFVLTSSSGEADGSFGFSLTADDASRLASISGQYLLDRIPPSMPTNLTAKYSRRGKTKGNTITFTNSTDDRSGVAGNNIYLNGVKKNTSLITSGSFRDSSGTVGMVYGVTAVDIAGNESAQALVVAK